MKHYVIGDIHGCGEELEGLLDKMSPTSSDRIILVGDVLDRGYGVNLVWDLIHEYGMSVLMGNHEFKMLQWLRGHRDYLPVGYRYAMNELVKSGRVTPRGLATWLEERRFMWHGSRFIVVHAGIDVNDPTRKSQSINCFGEGVDGWWDKYSGDKLIIYGHWRHDGVQFGYSSGRLNSLGIDTNCVFGKSLTGVCVEDFKFYTQNSRMDYHARLKKELGKSYNFCQELLNFRNL